jgi:serine protease Do
VDKLREYDEIIIKRKTDKNSKVTVEIKDGQVFVNGKPVSEFNDDNLSVRKKKIRIMDGRTFSFSGPGGFEGMEGFEAPEPPEAPGVAISPSPFRKHSGALSLNGDGWAESSSRAFLGVTSEKDEDKDGARITEISKGSAAEKAGLKEGDIILKVDEIKIESPESLSEAIHKYKPENKVTVTFLRAGKEQKVTAILGKSKTVTARTFNFDMPNMDNLDFAPRAYNYSYGNGTGKPRLGIKAQDTEDGKGVKVLEVGDESAAEKAGIKEGDIITRFDGKEVENATALSALARASKDKASVHINLIRDGKPLEIDIKTPRKLKTADL